MLSQCQSVGFSKVAEAGLFVEANRVHVVAVAPQHLERNIDRFPLLCCACAAKPFSPQNKKKRKHPYSQLARSACGRPARVPGTGKEG